MEEKTLVQIAQEHCQEIADKVFTTHEINHLRVEKAELSLNLEIILNKKQTNKKKIEEQFAENLKRMLAAPVKIKIKLL